jgi:glucan 1,3-beta-glucosidase
MTGNSDGFSNDYKTFLRKYWEAQVTAAEAVQGWVYWTWKVRQARRAFAEVQVLNLMPG